MAVVMAVVVITASLVEELGVTQVMGVRAVALITPSHPLRQVLAAEAAGATDNVLGVAAVALGYSDKGQVGLRVWLPTAGAAAAVGVRRGLAVTASLTIL
jgi:hypothetical protein